MAEAKVLGGRLLPFGPKYTRQQRVNKPQQRVPASQIELLDGHGNRKTSEAVSTESLYSFPHELSLIQARREVWRLNELFFWQCQSIPKRL